MGNKLNINQVTASERALYHSRKHGASLWDPRVKLLLLVIIIGLNIGLAINILSASLLGMGLILVAWTRPPLNRTMIFLLAPLIPTLIAFVGFSFSFGITPVFKVWNVVFYKEGFIQGGSVVLRVYCDIIWLILTFATSQFADILRALRWYKIPSILVDTLSMMYRYSFLLFEEFSRMYTAAYCRGGCNSRINTIKTISRIGARIFMRAFDRSERIYLARFARGGE